MSGSNHQAGGLVYLARHTIKRCMDNNMFTCTRTGVETCTTMSVDTLG